MTHAKHTSGKQLRVSTFAAGSEVTAIASVPSAQG